MTEGQGRYSPPKTACLATNKKHHLCWAEAQQSCFSISPNFVGLRTVNLQFSCQSGCAGCTSTLLAPAWVSSLSGCWPPHQPPCPAWDGSSNPEVRGQGESPHWASLQRWDLQPAVPTGAACTPVLEASWRVCRSLSGKGTR